MMKRSYALLKDHPVNQKRIAEGKNPANSLWIWGQGKKPALSSFQEKYGITGAAISAVDLIKGIALCAGLDSVDVPGATGTLHTNFAGKAQAAIEVFKSGKDFVYLHLEAPDECSHQGDLEGKISSLERIDKEVLKPILEYFRASGEDFSILELPDHRTPIALRTHTSEPVPFVLYRSNNEMPENQGNKFTEEAGKHGSYFDSGFALAEAFFGWLD
jgi:2,3-bisphosphoglycerate-independent phosphoglycerate mutase